MPHLRPSQADLPELGLPSSPPNDPRVLAEKLGIDYPPTGSRVRPSVPNARGRRALFDLMGGSQAREAAPASGLPNDPVLRLVNRINQGFQLSEYRRARRMGFQAYLEEQLDPASIDDSALDAQLATIPVLTMSPREVAEAYADEPGPAIYDLKGAMVMRSVLSKRQLFERMCEFWTDHFNIYHGKDPVFVMLPENDRLVTREHALGTFPEMLDASAHSAAMMFYLDNWLNFAGAPQENYARELLELHTMGVNGGYTETDVREVAKTLTGWSLNLDSSSPDYLRFFFNKPLHQTEIKTVLGVTIPAYSFHLGGRTVLELLGSHPSTAQFLATKLTRWLLNENPPASVVDDAAATYTATGGDIRAMIRTILTEENLSDEAGHWAPKYKRPFHYMVSFLRGLEADITDPLSLVFYLMTMGQSPYDWAPPNGYPDSVNVWGAGLLPRWSFISAMMQNQVPGTTTPMANTRDLIGGFQTEKLARRINQRLLGGALTRREERIIQEYVDSTLAPFVSWRDVYEAISLAASAPGYQTY